MLIYKITNKINNKIYIGQTTQKLKDRIRNYKSDTKFKSPDIARPIIKAMQKYGFENFKFEILVDNIETQEEMNILETKYILEFNTQDHNIGYNIENGGNSTGKHSKETKKKIGEAQLGSKNYMYGKKGKLSPSSKPIIDITTGEIFDSATEASIHLGLGASGVTKICASARGDRHSAYKHIYRYLENDKPIIVNLPISERNVNYILDLTENKKYKDLESASRLTRFKLESIRTCCRRKSSLFNHKFRYGEKHIIQYIKAPKIYDNILEKYKYVVNTVLSSINNRESVTTIPETEVVFR